MARGGLSRPRGPLPLGRLRKMLQLERHLVLVVFLLVDHEADGLAAPAAASPIASSAAPVSPPPASSAALLLLARLGGEAIAGEAGSLLRKGGPRELSVIRELLQVEDLAGRELQRVGG